jgi:hypothetical protein
VAGHVDRAAEAPGVEQIRERLALLGSEQRSGDGVADVVELLAQHLPVERGDARADGGRRVGGLVRSNDRGPAGVIGLYGTWAAELVHEPVARLVVAAVGPEEARV